MHPEGLRSGAVRRTGPATGYDNAVTQSGAWTNGFLTQGLAVCPDVDLGALYIEAQHSYVSQYPSAGDRPCFFARTVGFSPTNTEVSGSAPRNTYHSRDWL